MVVNDPTLSASQPLAELAASALNALGHAVEGPCTPLANPVATLAAHDGARLLARSLRRGSPTATALALGALLAGYVIDSTGYGLHHVLSQTLVRLAGAAHGPANAVLLCHTIGALAWRFPRAHRGARDRARGRPGGRRGAHVPARPARRGCVTSASSGKRSRECAEAAAERPELDLTAPRADRAELLALYEGAW